MEKINTKIIGNTTINEDSAFFGLVTGNMTIAGTVIFQLFGLVAGNLIIEKGVKADLYGLVNGDVINEGKLNIFGMVNGKVINSGRVTKDRKAVVRGGIVNKE